MFVQNYLFIQIRFSWLNTLPLGYIVYMIEMYFEDISLVEHWLTFVVLIFTDTHISLVTCRTAVHVTQTLTTACKMP